MQMNYDRKVKNPGTLRRRWGIMIGKLTRETHFDWEELESLCFVFHKLTRGTKGKMSRKDFIEVMHSALDMTNSGNVNYSYKNYDPNNMQYISMEDWCRGLSVALRGTLDEKIKYCFQTQAEELLEMVTTAVASDSEKGITPQDFSKAVKKYPMLLQFLGEVLPPRPAAQAFLATMMPRARPYEYCPDYRTEREPDPKPFRAFGDTGSQEVVHRLGGRNQVGRTPSAVVPQAQAAADL
ncbi:EF-hand calcium-binding domain-containing protein 1 [Frankliniella fusca]|uniref:EF-hand calcium-binding domain-containing protein 1 n=1 Tax=Frankliniella fusca TaxID=407009 RepID=A0AAE1HSE1_9NEOP|nr:EF-hand calcium-binding domain-containing protein 1 [Frankliniella fusca]